MILEESEVLMAEGFILLLSIVLMRACTQENIFFFILLFKYLKM